MTKWPSPLIKDELGFSLTELLVSMGLSLFVLAVVGSLFRSQTHTVKGQESRMEAHEYALTVLDVMIREVRNSGYFPKAPCDNTGGIVSATATSINFQYDKTGEGICDPSNNDEFITFAYDSTARNITRNGQALSDGNVTAVQFTYYPQQTSVTTPTPFSSLPLSASDRAAVKQIAISITVQPKSSDSQFTGSAVTMSATADLRNHGL